MREPAGAPAPQPVGPAADRLVDSISLFELPASRSARRAKLALVLLLDAILAGAGVVMLLSYLEERRDARRTAPSASLPESEAAEVEAPSPARPPATAEPVRAPGPAREGAAPAPTGSGSSGPPAGRGTALEPEHSPTPPLKAKPAARPRPTSAPGSGPEARTEVETLADEVAGDGSGWGPVAGRGADLSSVAAVAHPAAREWPSASEEHEIERIIARLRRVVDRHQADLEQCYVSAAGLASPGGTLEGRVDIRFTIMTDGSTADVTPRGNTTGSAALAECVGELIHGLRFPPLSHPLELEWPFLFRPSAE